MQYTPTNHPIMVNNRVPFRFLGVSFLNVDCVQENFINLPATLTRSVCLTKNNVFVLITSKEGGGALGCIRNRKTENKIVQNCKTAKKFAQHRKPDGGLWLCPTPEVRDSITECDCRNRRNRQATVGNTSAFPG